VRERLPSPPPSRETQRGEPDPQGLPPCYECRCDERLEPKGEESTCLTYTGLLVELEHLKIETRCVMGECVIKM
jgi:hypothetical protein